MINAFTAWFPSEKSYISSKHSSDFDLNYYCLHSWSRVIFQENKFHLSEIGMQMETDWPIIQEIRWILCVDADDPGGHNNKETLDSQSNGFEKHVRLVQSVGYAWRLQVLFKLEN